MKTTITLKIVKPRNNNLYNHRKQRKQRMKFRLDKEKIIMCFIAVLGMGFFLSFLILCNFGTDPATFMNRSISAKIGISFGTCQLIVNMLMFIIVIIADKSSLGFGTIFNMILVGYYADFFMFLWGKILDPKLFTEPVSRWIIFLVALALFIISVSVYINTDMGVAPYDALPIIIGNKVTERFPKLPKAVVRMSWDACAILIGILMGGTPIIGIILMAVFLGPVISLVGKVIK